MWTLALSLVILVGVLSSPVLTNHAPPFPNAPHCGVGLSETLAWDTIDTATGAVICPAIWVMDPEFDRSDTTFGAWRRVYEKIR